MRLSIPNINYRRNYFDGMRYKNKFEYLIVSMTSLQGHHSIVQKKMWNMHSVSQIWALCIRIIYKRLTTVLRNSAA